MQDKVKIAPYLVKEIGRISRNFIELSIESHKCLTFIAQYLEKEGSEKSKKFMRDDDGFRKWLGSLTDFSKFVKKHVQEGRLSLLNYLGEENGFYELKEKQKKRFDKKSVLLSELETMLQAVFNLKPVSSEVAKPPILSRLI